MTARTLLVGWDSASWNNLDPLLDRGELPALRGLVEAGCRGTLQSTMPPITPAAWSSIITGKIPQKHGVYDWVWESIGRLRFATSADRLGTPFWERLNAEGIRVGLVNIPITFPPTPLDGFMVCGFGAPDPPAELTYPPDLLTEIESRLGPYTPAVSPQRAHELRRGLGQYAAYEEEWRVQEAHVRIALYLADRYPVDVLGINLMLFDHMNHRAGDMAFVQASLRQMDRQLGQLIDGFRPDNVVVFSDHGARRVDGVFLLADWLSDHGYLIRQRRTNRTASELNYLLVQYLEEGWGLRGIAERAVRAPLRALIERLPDVLSRALWRSIRTRTPRAYDHYWFEEGIDASTSPVLSARSVGTVYLNRGGELPWQPMAPDQTVDGLAWELGQLPVAGVDGPLFQNVFHCAELYGEEPFGVPPDLVLDYHGSGLALHTNKGVGLAQREPYFALLADNPKADLWYGDHHPDGVYICSGSGFKAGRSLERARLVDVPATLLHLQQVAIPDDFDGRVLTSVLAEDRPVRSQMGDGARRRSPIESGYSEAEGSQVLSRLRALGYLA